MKHETYPTVVQALLLVLAVILLEVLVGAALADFRPVLNLTPSELAAFATLLGNGIVFATLLHLKSMKYADLFNPSGASVLAGAVLLGVPIAATIPLLVLLGVSLGDLLEMLFPLSAWEQKAFEEMAAQNVAAVMTVCVLAPVLEEMLFRGVILRAFLVQYPKRTAIGASALIFGAAHLNVYQFCIAFCLGLIAGWLYERARSLVPCIALHALYNASITMLEFRKGLHSPDGDSGFGLGTWALAALSAAGGVYALARLLTSVSGRSRDMPPGA